MKTPKYLTAPAGFLNLRVGNAKPRGIVMSKPGKSTLAARILLGLIFFVFGLNGFLHFIPQPPLEGKIAEFTNGLMAAGYFFPLLKGTETLCGALLLSGAFVPLALVALAPIVVNIVCVHVFLAPSGLPMAAIVSALMIYLSFFAQPYASIVRQIFRCPMKEAMDAAKNAGG
jgi:uncharacterized membrane protein YphA (DoxX/SURF4 family)